VWQGPEPRKGGPGSLLWLLPGKPSLLPALLSAFPSAAPGVWCLTFQLLSYWQPRATAAAVPA
jgi:hypothetical protein